METMSVEQYKQKSRELELREARNGLIAHALVITGVSVLLTAINLTFVPEFTWFVFPVAGMSFGVLVHYIFGVRLANRWIDQKEARIDQWR